MKKNILFIMHESKKYGATQSTLNLIDEFLKKENITINVLIPDKGPIEDELIKRNIKYKISKYYSWVQRKGENCKIKLHIKMILNFFYAIPIIRWVKKSKINIIHSISSTVFIGSYISKKTKIKHVWHIRELLEEDHNLEFVNKTKAVKILNSADRLIYVSKNVENKYKDVISKGRGKVIYNGIPNENYKNSKIPQLGGIFKILIAGNICDTKGQEEAIKAIELLKNNGINNIELNIAGDGSLEEKLKIYVQEKELQDQIRFIGFRNDLDEIRKNINIYLMCSKNEAFGRVTVESMMSKNLLIASNTGGTLEVIKDKENGLLYQQGDYTDLAKKIQFAINNWDNCKKIIENAYINAMNNYTIERCANEVLKIYDELLEGDIYV